MNYRLVAAVLVLNSAALFAQSQSNHPNASLSINGAGDLTSAGLLAPSNSNRPSPPATGAAVHFVGAPSAPARVRLRGLPNAGFLLFLGPKAPTPLVYNGQIVEIDLPLSILVLSGSLDAAGSFVVDYLPGFPAGFPTFFLQAGIADPGVAGGLRTTAMVGYEVRNDLPTLMRNVLDALAPDSLSSYPAYADALCSSSVRLDGASRTPLGGLGLTAQLAAMTAGDHFDRLEFLGLLPDATNQPALPTGAPTAGQTSTFAIDFVIHRTSTCGSASAATSEKQRFYGYRATGVAGNWRFDGNQRHARVAVFLEFEASGLSTIAVYLGLQVEDRLGLNGGLASVTVVGPQFPSPGVTVPAVFASASGFLVAAGSAPLFAPPAVETPAGPGATYAVTLNWTAAPSSSAVSVPLRSPYSPATGTASILAAIPAIAATTSVTAGGTGGAQLALSIFSASPLGTPLGAFEGTFEVDGDGPATGFFDFLGAPVDTTVTAQTITLCIPYLPATSSGISTDLYFQRTDIYDNVYFADLSGIL
jgi:hypothetical protein